MFVEASQLKAGFATGCIAYFEVNSLRNDSLGLAIFGTEGILVKSSLREMKVIHSMCGVQKLLRGSFTQDLVLVEYHMYIPVLVYFVLVRIILS